jgi:hypothetical protein
VVVTDYVWFTLFLQTAPAAPWIMLTTIMINLTLEAVVCSVLTEILVPIVKRAGVSFQA